MTSENQISESLNSNEIDLSEQLTHNQIFKLGFMDAVSFKLRGYAKVGSIKRGENQLEAYLIKCDIHGLQLTTPSGHYELLLCPACIKEREAKEKPKDKDSVASRIESAKILNKYLNKNLSKNR
jgi:hypothetical protein